MKNALIVLAVVALLVLTLGLFNREASVDVDYVVGVWRSVNVFWLFAIAAGVVVAAGLLGASLARAQGWRERGKLEKELLEVYRRLRAVEAQLEQGATTTGLATGSVEAITQAGEAAEGATAVTAPAETPTVISGPAEATTAVTEPAEAMTEQRPAGDVADEASTAISEAAEASTEERPAGEGSDEAGA